MAEPKAPEAPIEDPKGTPKEDPKGTPKADPKAPKDGKKKDPKKNDDGNEELAALKARAEKAESDANAMKGRLEKLQPLEKLAAALVPEYAPEGEDPAMLALKKVEQLESDLKSERQERSKESHINGLEVPDEVKSVLRKTVVAGDDLEGRVNGVVESLKPLIEKSPIAKPRPSGFVGGATPDLSDAKAWQTKDK